MACITNKLLETIRGRLGNVIFYVRGNRTFVRRRPAGRKNGDSPLQQQQRNRMKDVVAFYGVIRQSPLATVWKQAGCWNGMSAFNFFVKQNIAAFAGGNRVTDDEKLHFSGGPLPCGDCFRVVCQEEETTLRISWENGVMLDDKRQEDRFMAVILFENYEFLIFTGTESTYCRKDCQALIHLPEKGMPVRKVYCFFGAAGEDAYSADVCCRPEKEVF